MTGTSLFCRSRPSNSSPSMRGILMSRIARSTGSRDKPARASAPSAYESTRKPSASNAIDTEVRMLRSSSTRAMISDNGFLSLSSPPQRSRISQPSGSLFDAGSYPAIIVAFMRPATVEVRRAVSPRGRHGVASQTNASQEAVLRDPIIPGQHNIYENIRSDTNGRFCRSPLAARSSPLRHRRTFKS